MSDFTFEHLFQGIHILGEMYGIDSSVLDNKPFLEKLLIQGIQKSGATLCNMQFEKFEPHGVTLLALLSESHASIHTYPDKGALFFDAFTCGTICQPQQIAISLVKGLNPSHHELKTIRRGDFSMGMPTDNEHHFPTYSQPTLLVSHK